MRSRRNSTPPLREAITKQARSLLERIPAAHMVHRTPGEWDDILYDRADTELLKRANLIASLTTAYHTKFEVTLDGRECAAVVYAAELFDRRDKPALDAAAHPRLMGELQDLLDAADRAAVALHGVNVALNLYKTGPQLARAWPQLLQLVEHQCPGKVALARASAPNAHRVHTPQSFVDLFKFAEHQLAAASLYPDTAGFAGPYVRVHPTPEHKIHVDATDTALDPLY